MIKQVLSSLFKTSLIVSSLGSTFATESQEIELSPSAPTLFDIPLPYGHQLPVTNSMIMMISAIIVLTILIRLATRHMKLIPGKLQNIIEMIYEGLFTFFVGIMGEKLTRKTFWYFSTTFILILTCNWMGLIPGVGVITYTNDQGITTPLFRGANADLNVTMGLGLLYALLWLYWAIREIGVGGLLKDIFGPKGGFKGLMLVFLTPIFFLVGLIDVISISLRPITLGARLYGNIFAGEQIIDTMSNIAPPYISWLCVLPFFFMELFVGLLQALVFTLLGAVFLSMICKEEEIEEAEEAQEKAEEIEQKLQQQEKA